MNIDVQYLGESGVHGDIGSSHLGLATNALRPQGFIRAHLTQVEQAREVLGALHGVVISDLKRRPRDRGDWQRWLAEQDRKFLSSIQTRSSAAKDELDRLEQRLDIPARPSPG